MDESKQKKFKKAFKANNCKVCDTCEDVGIDVEEFHAFLSANDAFRLDLEIIEFYFVKDKLFGNIAAGMEKSILSYIDTNGKKFGIQKDTDKIDNIEVKVKFI